VRLARVQELAIDLMARRSDNHWLEACTPNDRKDLIDNRYSRDRFAGAKVERVPSERGKTGGDTQVAVDRIRYVQVVSLRRTVAPDDWIFSSQR
jgi:hypothetical protein